MVSKWNIDASHSSLQFSVRHMVIAKVRGAFKSYEGSLALDEDRDLELTAAELVVDAASIDTAEPKRDEHLKSADFLDVASYPTLRFQSRSIERHAERYRVTGDLTLHGVTRPVVLDAEFQGQGKDPWGNRRAVFSARTSVNREEFGLTWNQVLEAGGVLVGTKIDIEIEVEAVAAASAEGSKSASAAA